jgi:hypothetical protein
VPKLSSEFLNAAIAGYEKQRADLTARIAELKRMLGGGDNEPAVKTARLRKRRRLSAAGRKAISEAAKRRWALRRQQAAKE